MQKLLTIRAAARELAIGWRWLREEALAGRIPCLRVGRRILVDLNAVSAELAKRAATSREGGAR